MSVRKTIWSPSSTKIVKSRILLYVNIFSFANLFQPPDNLTWESDTIIRTDQDPLTVLKIILSFENQLRWRGFEFLGMYWTCIIIWQNQQNTQTMQKYNSKIEMSYHSMSATIYIGSLHHSAEMIYSRNTNINHLNIRFVWHLNTAANFWNCKNCLARNLLIPYIQNKERIFISAFCSIIWYTKCS